MYHREGGRDGPCGSCGRSRSWASRAADGDEPRGGQGRRAPRAGTRSGACRWCTTSAATCSSPPRSACIWRTSILRQDSCPSSAAASARSSTSGPASLPPSSSRLCSKRGCRPSATPSARRRRAGACGGGTAAFARELDGDEHLVAGRFTVADVMVGTTLMSTTRAGIADELDPSLKDYVGRLSLRPPSARCQARARLRPRTSRVAAGTRARAPQRLSQRPRALVDAAACRPSSQPGSGQSVNGAEGYRVRAF